VDQVWAPTLGRRQGRRHVGLTIDLATKRCFEAKCPQRGLRVVFVFFFSSRDLKTVIVVSVVGCVDRCHRPSSEAVRACGHPGWSARGQFGRPVDEFFLRPARPQFSLVVPTVVPRLGPVLCPASVRCGLIESTLSSDVHGMWTACGVRGDGHVYTLGIYWGRHVDQNPLPLLGDLRACGATVHSMGRLPCGTTTSGAHRLVSARRLQIHRYIRRPGSARVIGGHAALSVTSVPGPGRRSGGARPSPCGSSCPHA
jgi:hypothetical protein